jgi:ATP-dependent helicase HepA
MKMDTNLNILLPTLSRQLALYLEKVLPLLCEDWWVSTVVKQLSFQQCRRLEQHKISTLSSLDLAALLRIFDSNWYSISTKLNLPSESRHFVKEMLTVRNRWAHAGSNGFLMDDVYRDLDTLQRFATIIDGDGEFLPRRCFKWVVQLQGGALQAL